jgi:hypothetical protein
MQDHLNPRAILGYDSDTKSVIRHAYSGAMDTCARLHAFATAVIPDFFGAIRSRQEILAADDLVLFAIHARRLIELTVGKEFANQQPVPLVYYENSQSSAPFWRIINVVVHHKKLLIARTIAKELTGDWLVDIQDDNRVSMPAICRITSNEGKTVVFRVRDLIEAFAPDMIEVMATRHEVLQEVILDEK